MRLAICLLAATLLNVGSVAARDIFVNNLSGDDTLTGQAPVSKGRQNGPVRSIAKALRLAQPGDHIVLADTGEPYREQVTVQGGPRSGLAPGLPLVIEGGGATIDGSIPVPDDGWESVGGDVFRFAPELKSHQILTLDGQRAVRVPAAGGGKAIPQLAPLEWCLQEGYIYLRVRPGQIPQQYYPAFAGLQTGITVYEVRDVVIRNVVVRGFALDGVNAHDNAFNLVLDGVVSQDNGRSGFSIGGASQARLERCQAVNNFVAQLRTEGYSHTRLVDCTLDDAAAPAIQSDGGEVVEER